MDTESNYVVLENNEKYVILDDIKGSCDFVYLTSAKDARDFLILKLKMIDNEEFLVNLDSDLEFDEAMSLFEKKHGKK